MNTIVPFNFNGAEIRAITKDGEPWFVAADICRTLEIQNTTQALDALESDERSMQYIGRQGEANLVNESGLYALIFKSRKPEAVQFRKWVTSEVLPQIRKTGGYGMPSHAEALRLYADKLEETEALKLVVAAQQPAVEFVEKYVKAEGLFGIRQTAKILGLQQNAFVKMCEGEVLFREGGYLVPYSEWITAGYCHVKTGEANGHSFPQTRFTSRGIEWVRRKLAIAALLGEDQKAA